MWYRWLCASISILWVIIIQIFLVFNMLCSNLDTKTVRLFSDYLTSCMFHCYIFVQHHLLKVGFFPQTYFIIISDDSSPIMYSIQLNGFLLLWLFFFDLGTLSLFLFQIHVEDNIGAMKRNKYHLNHRYLMPPTFIWFCFPFISLIDDESSVCCWFSSNKFKITNSLRSGKKLER